MATRKVGSYNELERLLEQWSQAECLRLGLPETAWAPARTRKMEGIESGWIVTFPGQYRPYHIAGVHIHVEAKETELNQRIEELEKVVGRLAEQLREARENLTAELQPSYVALSREQRVQAARMQVARQVELARAIGKSPADLVEELTSLFPMSEEKADSSQRED